MTISSNVFTNMSNAVDDRVREQQRFIQSQLRTSKKEEESRPFEGSPNIWASQVKANDNPRPPVIAASATARLASEEDAIRGLDSHRDLVVRAYSVIAEQDVKVNALTDSSHALQMKIEELGKSIASLETENRELRRRIEGESSLISEIKSMSEKRAQDSKWVLEKTEERCKTLTNEVKDISALNHQLRSEILKEREQRSAVNEELARANENIELQKAKVKDGERRIHELEASRNDLQLQKEMSDAESMQTTERQKVKIKDLEARCRELETLSEDMRRAKENRDYDFIRLEQKYRQELKLASEKNEELDADRLSCKQKASEHRRSLAEMGEKLHATTERLAEKTEELAEATRLLDLKKRSKPGMFARNVKPSETEISCASSDDGEGQPEQKRSRHDSLGADHADL